MLNEIYLNVKQVFLKKFNDPREVNNANYFALEKTASIPSHPRHKNHSAIHTTNAQKQQARSEINTAFLSA